MVRSVGILTIVVGLAWTGLAGAQSSSPLEKSRYINVSEEGKPSQRCKLLKTWRETSGAVAFQVQAVDTGEMMTVVGTSPQGAGSAARQMSTRIFRWGSSKTPPAGAPVPPADTLLTARPARPAQPPSPVQQPAKVVPQPIRPAPVAATTRPAPIPQTVQKPTSAPASTPTILTNNKAASSAVAAKPASAASSKPLPLPSTSSHTVQYSPASAGPNRLPDVSSVTNAQPRLSPLAAGSVGSQSSCNCPTPCDSCCQPCAPCSQAPCDCCTTQQPRQRLIGKLFKSNTPCPCTTVVSQPLPAPTAKPAAATPPAPVVVQTTTKTEPAKPNDWRQSWGQVEPWKASAQANSVKPIEVSRRADPKPVTMESPTQPDPLKNPDQYRDLVMSSHLANSKIQQPSSPPVIVQQKKSFLPKLKIGPPPAMQSNETLRPGQMVVVNADEPNAFWTPKSPNADHEQAKLSGFERQPPQGVPPSIAGLPPSLPGVAVGMLPRPPVMNMPTPPLPPPAMQRGPVAMAPDSGVPEAMGNAFTLAATRRPIPADFGGTPQEPNGFDPMARPGQGTPPQGYGMGMPGANRQQMAMGPQAPMGVNPYMSVPPSQTGQAVASAAASAPSVGVPQLLAALKDSLRPSERESAAEQLSELNWRIQPMVVESLMKAAREDPAATVRAACVHALAHMKVGTPAAVALVRDLKSDRDPQVRQEAEEALNALGDSGIQQASQK